MAGPAYYTYDGARVSAESSLGKELAKWERPADFKFQPYPRMLYRATHRPDGRRSVGEVLDSLFGGTAGAAEQWTRRCQLTVQDEQEHSKYREMGWRDTPQEALALLEAQDDARSNETAERHFKDSRMSEKAQKEAAAADQAAGLKQLPVVPETPVRKGWTPARRAAQEAKMAAKAAARPQN